MEDGTLSLYDEGEGYSLQRRDANGTTTSISLSPGDVMTLGQSGPLFRQRVQARFYPPGVDYTPVFMTPVVQCGLHLDALNENILLTLISPNGEELKFEIRPTIAEALAQKLPSYLADLKATKPKAQ